MTGSGAGNQLVELAAHTDDAEFQDANLQLRGDADWLVHRRLTGRALLNENTTLLNPTLFSPLKTAEDVLSAIDRGKARDTPMLFGLRTYTSIPGKMPTVLKNLIEEGNPLTHQFVESPVGYFTAETGIANRVMILWAYSSAAERARRKALMLHDPRFQELGSRFNLNFI